MLCLPSWYAQGTQQAQKSVSDRRNKKHSAQKITLLHPVRPSSEAVQGWERRCASRAHRQQRCETGMAPGAMGKEQQQYPGPGHGLGTPGWGQP